MANHFSVASYDCTRKVSQAHMLFDIEVVYLNRPALVRDTQDWLCRQREVRTQKILRVFVPMVPLTNEYTDLKRQGIELALERPHQVRPLPLVCSGQLHTLIPLMPERLGPLGELPVIQLAIGLDCTYDMPVLTAAAFEQAIGGIPTVAEHGDLQARGQPLLSLRQHRLGQRCLLATGQPLLRDTLTIETPHRLLAEGEPPIICIGPCAEC
jgi:hypothetical protein